MAFHLSIQQQLNGQGVLIAYSGELMLMTMPSLEKIFPIFLNIIAISGAIGSIVVLKCLGRKGALIYGSFLIGIFLFIVGYNFYIFNFDDLMDNSSLSKSIFVVMIVLIRFVFSLTLGPIVWLYITEIVQPNIVPFATTLNWISVSLVNTFFPILMNLLGGNPSYIFFFFGAYTFVSGIVNCILV